MSMPWYGEIPEHWEAKRVASILTQRREKNDPVQTDFILSLSAKSGVVPYSERTEKGGNKPKEDLTKYSVARANDLLVNCMNVLAGSSGVTKWDGAISPVYYALCPRNENDVNIWYYNYVFRLITFYRSLIGLGKGILFHETDSGSLNTIRLRIAMTSLNNVSLPLPPRDEQDQIVRYLDWKVSGINKLINAKRRQIELLGEQKRVLIEDALSSVSGQTVLCRYLGSLQNGISEAGDFFTAGTPFVNYSDVYKNAILPSAVTGIAKANKKQQETYSVVKCDIFFTRTSETIDEVGLAAVCDETISQAVFSGFVLRFRPRQGVFYNPYAKYFFRSIRVRDYFTQEMNLVTRVSLGQTLLKNLPVLLPDLNVQSNVAECLDELCAKIDKIVDKLNTETILLQEYCTRLISDAITGKLDVCEVVVPDYVAVEGSAGDACIIDEYETEDS